MKMNNVHIEPPPAVVVTGVSTGIGEATVRVLAARGAHVFGSVRQAADGERLRDHLGALAGRFTPLVLDVTDGGAVARAVDAVRASLGGRRLRGLVNNAGIALGGPLALQPLDEVRRQFEVNVVGALAVTQAFLPLLGTDPALRGAPGRVVNVSSVGGRIGPPFLGAYAATKHALEGMSESLRRELLGFGIDVVIVGPGSVATSIWDKAEHAGTAAYRDTPYAAPLGRFLDTMVADGRRGLSADRIGEVVWHALTTRSPRTRYAVVPGALWNWVLPRLLPARVVDRLIASRLGIGAAR